jgi:hypothetical protein
MQSENKKKIIQVGVIIAVLLTIFVNAIAVILPLNGKTTQELSDALPNLFVPVGLTFSIWGVIYILLLVFAGYQARDFFSKQKKDMPWLQPIAPWFFLSSLANIAWIFSWHYQQVGLSLLMMFILLISLILIYLKLNIGKAKTSLHEKLGVHLLFSVYLGWITVATIANVTAWLVSIHWDGWGISPGVWTILVISVAVLITYLMLFIRKDMAYSLVVAWAALGIYLKQTMPPVNTDVSTTALVAMILIVIGILVVLAHYFLKRKPTSASS